MQTIEFLDHLTTIFLDLVVPALLYWMVTQIKGFFARGPGATAELSDTVRDLTNAVKRQSAPPAAVNRAMSDKPSGQTR